tara:strand:+ start:1577 stop:2713 length:1137 start_codon:yes stop_codon:yes gene_type:complete
MSYKEDFVDDEWDQFIMSDDIFDKPDKTVKTVKTVKTDNIKENIPVCEELYISTKTKVLFLNSNVDINTIYWKLPIIDYGTPTSGILKKQMKIISNTIDEVNEYKNKLINIAYYNEHILKQIDTTNVRGSIFKDERKITIGISKKDIMNCRGKPKNAFYNCFAIIIRFKYNGLFKEIHIKIFNTGKLEIPGIVNDELLNIVKTMIINILQPFFESNVQFVDKASNNVLINSNFNCGFYINRDILHNSLKNKYNIETSYDPCSYPGVKCKYYYNNNEDHEHQNGQILQEDCNQKVKDLNVNKKYTEVSFMLFRTGSCLIVGNCNEPVLYHVYNFIKNLLQEEYLDIMVINDTDNIKKKTVKVRKKIINITNDYLNIIKN